MDDKQISSHRGDFRPGKAAQILLAPRFAIPGARIILFAPLVLGYAPVNGALVDPRLGGAGCKCGRLQQLSSPERADSNTSAGQRSDDGEYDEEGDCHALSSSSPRKKAPRAASTTLPFKAPIVKHWRERWYHRVVKCERLTVGSGEECITSSH